MDWYLAALKKYAEFSGRARRREYWFFFLFNLIIQLVLAMIEEILGIAPNSRESILAGIYGLAVFIPTLAVGVRRLHDTNHSGWWLLIGLIPLIGVLVLLFFFVSDSDSGPNQYGPDPKGVSPEPGTATA
jgi:uncharacterized membrane protein YhaH (DUF805 family)